MPFNLPLSHSSNSVSGRATAAAGHRPHSLQKPSILGELWCGSIIPSPPASPLYKPDVTRIGNESSNKGPEQGYMCPLDLFLDNPVSPVIRKNASPKPLPPVAQVENSKAEGSISISAFPDTQKIQDTQLSFTRAENSKVTGSPPCIPPNTTESLSLRGRSSTPVVASEGHVSTASPVPTPVITLSHAATSTANVPARESVVQFEDETKGFPSQPTGQANLPLSSSMAMGAHRTPLLPKNSPMPQLSYSPSMRMFNFPSPGAPMQLSNSILNDHHTATPVVPLMPLSFGYPFDHRTTNGAIASNYTNQSINDTSRQLYRSPNAFFPNTQTTMTMAAPKMSIPPLPNISGHRVGVNDARTSNNMAQKIFQLAGAQGRLPFYSPQHNGAGGLSSNYIFQKPQIDKASSPANSFVPGFPSSLLARGGVNCGLNNVQKQNASQQNFGFSPLTIPPSLYNIYPLSLPMKQNLVNRPPYTSQPRREYTPSQYST
ncbi:hypothetical protein AX17_001574 [Amanita inopinata Kibby_2008]|nr:hypothetical protein AX17_001574 [Amanita inopinata Kibby_2008]